jgi:hypothetical protein
MTEGDFTIVLVSHSADFGRNAVFVVQMREAVLKDVSAVFLGVGVVEQSGQFVEGIFERLIFEDQFLALSIQFGDQRAGALIAFADDAELVFVRNGSKTAFEVGGSEFESDFEVGGWLSYSLCLSPLRISRPQEYQNQRASHSA